MGIHAVVFTTALTCCSIAIGREPQFATPQEAFTAYRLAIATRDWKAYWRSQTTTSKNDCAKVFVAIACSQAFVKPGELSARTLLVSYDIDLSKAKNVAIGLVIVDEEETATTNLSPLVTDLQDRLDDFLADCMDLVIENEKRPDKEALLENYGRAELRNIEISGDDAKGNLVITADGQSSMVPMSFQKINGCWLVHRAGIQFLPTGIVVQ